MLGYCEELGIPLEVEINSSRSALMQSDELNGSHPVEHRQVVYDTRGHLAELFSNGILTRPNMMNPYSVKPRGSGH
jgi:monoamine oxidase